MARDPETALACAGTARASGGNLSARRQALSRLLSVRRQARPPDARHAAHAPARTCPAASARLHGQPICARRVGTGRRGLAHRPPRAGPWRGGRCAARGGGRGAGTGGDAVSSEKACAPHAVSADQQAQTATPIEVAGAAFVGDPAGALYWPAQGLLAVADLHLEK